MRTNVYTIKTIVTPATVYFTYLQKVKEDIS